MGLGIYPHRRQIRGIRSLQNRLEETLAILVRQSGTERNNPLYRIKFRRPECNCVSATSSHYDWAIKKIRKHKKTAGSAEP
ncbi:ClbS/DfsB family four-helix bundle protein [Tannerella forsythia]|uniref:ClbS/DfsB family four-helix bundle protein n=1 Tax=Tannerella forsythia TaxID=28112 RepID=UPI003C74A1C1